MVNASLFPLQANNPEKKILVLLTAGNKRIFFQALQFFDVIFETAAAKVFGNLIFLLFCQMIVFPLQFCEDTVFDLLFACVARSEQIFQQLFHGLVDRYGFHAGGVVQIFIYSCCVEDIEVGLANLRAESRCAPQHLLKEDTAVDLTHKDQVTDPLHINAC